ncbi:MAG: phosphonate transporter, permease protein PhnE [Deinococcota bacterium]|jgi:phosphonate transport system permease protein
MTKNLLAPAKIIQQRNFSKLVWLGVAILLFWATFGTELSIPKLISGFGESQKLLFGTAERPDSGFFPPDFTRGWIFVDQMLLTVKMAIWGTVLAAIAALPISILAAANTAPNKIVYQIARRVLDVLRGLNEFVLALIFVAAVGLGPFPGILALAVHTTGVLAKLYAEAIEVVDNGQIEAVQASGANPIQVFTHAIFPQIVPTVVSMSLYRFESNVRAASVLGLVGAGGIGLFVTETMRSFNFKEASAVLLVILVAVFLVDFISAKIRARLT